MYIAINIISDKFDNGKISMNGFGVIALDLAKTRRNWLVYALEILMKLGMHIESNDILVKFDNGMISMNGFGVLALDFAKTRNQINDISDEFNNGMISMNGFEIWPYKIGLCTQYRLKSHLISMNLIYMIIQY